MVKKEKVKSYSGVRWFVILLILALVVYFIWFAFFSYKECDTWDCFNSRLEECKRTTFIGGTDMVFEYVIQGDKGDNCNVDVRLLQGEVSNKDSQNLEGKVMSCGLPRGLIVIPQADIDNCHGDLKEGLQDLVILKLHSYIVENLGRINLEVMDAPSTEK